MNTTDIRIKRKQSGIFDSRAALAFAAMVIGGLVILGITKSHVYTEKDLAVVSVQGPYRYTFQHVDEWNRLIGDQFTEDICEDYEAPLHDFTEGIILSKLIHTEEGGCWSLNPDKHCGYFKRRDEQKRPIYAMEAKQNGY